MATIDETHTRETHSSRTSIRRWMRRLALSALASSVVFCGLSFWAADVLIRARTITWPNWRQPAFCS